MRVRDLPTDIIEWVSSILARHGRQIPEAWTDDHLSIYQLLRLEVQNHIDIGSIQLYDSYQHPFNHGLGSC